MITPLNPQRAHRSPFHSQGMLITDATRLVTVAGQVGVSPDGRIGDGVHEQTTLAMANIVAVLAEAELRISALASLTVYLTNPADIGPFTEAAGAFLDPDPTQRPATTLLILPQLASPALLVQIAAFAAG